jgi:putative ABC transport system permease protein
MGTFLQDVSHSIRMFRRSPGFTITALAALALGIGATTAIFSLVNAILLKPMPVPDPDRFMMMMTQTEQTGTYAGASPAKFAYWRAQSSVLQDVSAYYPGVMNYTGGEVAEQLRSMQMSSDAFHCWGTPILRGRSFTPEDDAPGGPRVTLIGRSFGSGASPTIRKFWARPFP